MRYSFHIKYIENITFGLYNYITQLGKTPLQLARENYKDETVKYLESYLKQVCDDLCILLEV